MVINRDPEGEQKKKNAERLNRTDDEIKDDLFAKFREYSNSIICLAFMYAKNFEELGKDVTKEWVTTQQQLEVIEAAYKKGYEKGVMDGRRVEREQIQKNFDLVRHKNPHFREDVNYLNGNFGTNLIQQPLRNVVQPTNAKHSRKGTKKRHRR